MTTNLNRNQSKTRERHSDAPTRRSSRPSSRKDEGQGQSADEIRETVKEAVGKGVSAVAGAVEGVAETMEETQLAETAESAIHQVGGTVNKVVQATKEETENLKQALKGEGGEGEDSSEEDFQIERDDPTLAGKAFTPTTPLSSRSLGETEASSSGSPLTYGSDESQDASTYSPSEDDESKAI
jgi:hypothetical protein